MLQIIAGFALAPFTGGTSLTLVIAATAITTGALAYAASSKEDARNEGKAEGVKAGERAAQMKYETIVQELVKKLQSYKNTESILIAMYAVGLAIANADGSICKEVREKLDLIVTGCMAGYLPNNVRVVIEKLIDRPPTPASAFDFAIKVGVAKQDINDIIDVVIHAKGFGYDETNKFLNLWHQLFNQANIA